MTTPIEPKGPVSPPDSEREETRATPRRSPGPSFGGIAQGATARAIGTVRRVGGRKGSGRITAQVPTAEGASARVGRTVGTAGGLAASAAETGGSAATKTVGSTARTATKTVGSAVQGAARTVGPVLAGGVGASFSFLVARAMLVLELIKRIVSLVIEALHNLARRLRERRGAETEPSSKHPTEADEHGAGPVPM